MSNRRLQFARPLSAERAAALRDQGVPLREVKRKTGPNKGEVMYFRDSGRINAGREATTKEKVSAAKKQLAQRRKAGRKENTVDARLKARIERGNARLKRLREIAKNGGKKPRAPREVAKKMRALRDENAELRARVEALEKEKARKPREPRGYAARMLKRANENVAELQTKMREMGEELRKVRDENIRLKGGAGTEAKQEDNKGKEFYDLWRKDPAAAGEKAGSMVRDLYWKTFRQHRGTLTLPKALDMLQKDLGVSIDDAKRLVLMARSRGDLQLEKAVHMEGLTEDQVIREDWKNYFALKIPDLIDKW